MLSSLSEFQQIWGCDFEYQPLDGDLPRPICMVAIEFKTGRKIRLDENQLREFKLAPFDIGAPSLFVAYFSTAEFSCFHALGWPLPRYCLDLFVEFRNLTNGTSLPNGAGLLSALSWFDLDCFDVTHKEAMRNLAIRGGEFSETEMDSLINYCESDVIALQNLLPAMISQINLPLALLRGRYMKAASVIEKNGVPIDIESLDLLKSKWDKLKEQLVERIDKDFGVFDGLTFKREKFESYLNANNLSWPRTPSGALALDEDTFRDMTKSYPQLSPIKELRHTLAQLRLTGLMVGKDGRNRTSLSSFRARTGRNQPSNTESIFGPSCWFRGLIKPPPNFAIAYLDWSQQEFGIAAALSGDQTMKDAYLSGDPYLAFAKQAGAVPPDGTKKTHAEIRDQFKACVLAVQYGMGEDSLAIKIGQTRAQARYLLQLHRQTYKTFWEWSDRVVDNALITNTLQTVFGWHIHLDNNPNGRSLRNFPMQANGSEMLRLACCLLVEAGIEVCLPVHDALLIMAPEKEMNDVVHTAQNLMEEASSVILSGFKLRTDVKIVTYPDRYMDPRGTKMWNTTFEIINELQQGDMS